MRVIHFCDTIAIGGGIASFVGNLSSEQSKFMEVSIGVINDTSRDKTVSLPTNIEVIDFKKTKPGFSLIYPIKIFLYLLRNKYDVVHIHSSFFYYYLSILLLHNKIRFIYTVHSDAIKENSSIWDKRLWKLKRNCFRLNWILPVTISPNSKVAFDDFYGMSSALVINGIANSPINCKYDKLYQYRMTERTKLLLHVGRITEAKNQVVLCRAVSELITEGYDVSLIIVGVNQDTKIFEELQCLFCDRIIYLGARYNIREMFAVVDAMCLPSLWEGLPITLLEALSVGCIPICTPVGGIKNVITDGRNGILSSSPSLLDYKLAIQRFLTLDENTLTHMKSRAHESFEQFDIRNTAIEYMKLYDR